MIETIIFYFLSIDVAFILYIIWIEKKEIIGGETKIRTVSKFELITTHTARRTAATHMYLRNMLPIDIMKITGHKTESSFLKYICVPKEESVKRMAQNKFFK